MAFVHIDCDLYESTRDALDAVACHLVPGSVVAFDEFMGYPGWSEHGEARAWWEVVEQYGLEYRYMSAYRMRLAVKVTRAATRGGCDIRRRGGRSGGEAGGEAGGESEAGATVCDRIVVGERSSSHGPRIIKKPIV